MIWGSVFWLAALQTGLFAAALRHGELVKQPAAGPSRAAAASNVVGGWDLCARPNLRADDRNQKIPKVVHHTYKNETLPWRLGLFRMTWPYLMGKRWNTSEGWTEQFWSDDGNRNLIKDHYPWFLETYDSYEEVISRVDAARIFYLHKYGGVYSDLDIELLRDPAPLFSGDTDLVFFYQRLPHFRDRRMVDPVQPYELSEVTNAIMASVPGHPFWLFLAERMMRSAKNRPVLTGKNNRSDTRIFWTSGPCVLQNALAEYQLRDPHTKVAFYPMRLWAPISYDDTNQADKCQFLPICQARFPQAYFISHWTGTWNHCEVGTCTGDNVTIVSLLGVSSEVKEARKREGREMVCI